jgi:Pentapeptide repeats (9 copies)
VRFARFDGATFAGHALFAGVTFARYVSFHEATFVGSAFFMGATFAGHATFDEATFAESASFDEATFVEKALFRRTQFGRAEFVMVGFDGVEFGENAEFEGARVALTSLYVDGALNIDGVLSSLDVLGVVLPMGWTTRVAQPAEGEDEGWLYMVREAESSEQPAEATEDGEDQTGGEART